MAERSQQETRPLRMLFMSTYVPRPCGIATYAEDVIHAVEPHGASCQVLAMTREGQQYEYEARVVGTVVDDQPDSYLAAAELVNRGKYDVLSLQHEFGIYGGEDAEVLPAFLAAVKIPVVATLHTILRNPPPGAQCNLHTIGQRVQRVVTMNGLAPEMLTDIYGVPAEKICVIHHGAPATPYTRQPALKAELGLEGRTVLANFGLHAPVKGLQYAIQAMPHIIAKYPDALLLILGQTHPVIVQEEGEWYRDELESLVDTLGLRGHVQFVNRFLEKDELVRYLLATDTYIIPYTNMEQITSGTLAYAIAAGCPVVATPFLHAQFMLESGGGVLVPPRDPAQLAQGVLGILDNPALQSEMIARNWEFGKTLLWPRVGLQYRNIFAEAMA